MPSTTQFTMRPPQGRLTFAELRQFVEQTRDLPGDARVVVRILNGSRVRAIAAEHEDSA